MSSYKMKLYNTINKRILGNRLRSKGEGLFFDMEAPFNGIYNKCQDYTMTSKERCYGLFKATEYIIEAGIKGDFVECGVWKGGSSMIMAHTLMAKGVKNRNIYLYDTYSGMTKPTDKDVKGENDSSALEFWSSLKPEAKWWYCGLDDVKSNLLSTGYPKNNLKFVKGDVKDTIPLTVPDKISLLRLDTDFYESTYHELLYLFPKLTKNGVIIIDDYGHWKGAREAVDTYFDENNIKILLNRIDYTGRVGLKSN